MAVVINDLEIATDGPQPEQRGGGDGGGGGAAAEQQQQPKPEEVERALRAQLERAERVWAH
ncbi:MAG: hypothetical protein LC800_03400 [Acidobacteria bacterium]|nr:hypothetical protein [Acidobacteriota bacterium]